MPRLMILRFASTTTLSALLISACAASKRDTSGNTAGVDTSANAFSAYSTSSSSQPQPVDMQRESAPRSADPHEPRPSPRDRAVVNSIMRLTGDAYDKAFRDYMVQHHQLGIGMIDRALPQLRYRRVKTLAERMRAAHLRGLKTISQTTASNP